MGFNDLIDEAVEEVRRLRGAQELLARSRNTSLEEELAVASQAVRKAEADLAEALRRRSRAFNRRKGFDEIVRCRRCEVPVQVERSQVVSGSYVIRCPGCGESWDTFEEVAGESE